jgi:hypothetical protein
MAAAVCVNPYKYVFFKCASSFSDSEWAWDKKYSSLILFLSLMGQTCLDLEKYPPTGHAVPKRPAFSAFRQQHDHQRWSHSWPKAANAQCSEDGIAKNKLLDWLQDHADGIWVILQAEQAQDLTVVVHVYRDELDNVAATQMAMDLPKAVVWIP